MSLDIWLTAVRKTSVFEANITHNLNEMADEAGIYMHLWHPEDIGIKKAADLIAPLKNGIAAMEADPQRFIAFEPENKFGTYETFLPWLKLFLAACEENPDAEIEVSR